MSVWKEELELNKGTKIILLVISMALILFVINGVNNFFEYQAEECRINKLDENEIDVKAIIIGEGNEKGLVKVKIILNNSKGIITNAKISKIRNAYEVNSIGYTEYYEGEKSDFSQLKSNSNNDEFSTEFEISKNKKYTISLDIRNNWDQTYKTVSVNTWE